MRITYRYGSLILCGLLMALLAGCVFDFSPDGNRVVFTNSTGQLALMDIDGTNYQVISHGDVGIDPTWSPDGKSIVFKQTIHRADPGLSEDMGVKRGKLDQNDIYLYDVEKQKSRKFADASSEGQQ